MKASEAVDAVANYVEIQSIPDESAKTIGLIASARAQRLCIQNVTHELVLSWEILNGQRPASVHAELAYPDGHLEQIGLKPIRGTQSFPINYPKGGTVTARVIARDSTDSPAIGEASVRLEACGK